MIHDIQINIKKRVNKIKLTNAILLINPDHKLFGKMID